MQIPFGGTTLPVTKSSLSWKLLEIIKKFFHFWNVTMIFNRNSHNTSKITGYRFLLKFENSLRLYIAFEFFQNLTKNILSPNQLISNLFISELTADYKYLSNSPIFIFLHKLYMNFYSKGKFPLVGQHFQLQTRLHFENYWRYSKYSFRFGTCWYYWTEIPKIEVK